MKYSNWARWPLFLHSRHLARDLDALRETVNQEMVGIDVTCLAKQHVDMGYMGHVKLPGFEVGFIRYGMDVRILCQLDNFYTFVLPYNGKARLFYKHHPDVQNGYTVFLPPGTDLDMLYSGDCGHLLVRFAQNPLIDEVLQELFFDWTLQDVDLQIKLRQVCDRFLMDYTLAASFDVSLALINSFKIDFLDTILMHQTATLIAPKIIPDEDVLRIIRFIDDNSHWEYNVDELVTLVGIPVRTLYWKFNQQLAISPYRYYLNQKLMQVRLSMLTSDPEHISVTEQALNSGFHHLSRFSQQYRLLFGELPKETLKNLRFVRRKESKRRGVKEETSIE
jgi:AraC-like DNA-binding protein